MDMTVNVKRRLITFLVIQLLWPCAFAVTDEVQLTMSESPLKTGQASWYSETDPGILPTTANMEIFDDQQLTCAMWDIPFNTLVEVTNVQNGKSVIVRVNDRGPARRLVRQGRIIDLTKQAFSQIADLEQGLIPIELKILQTKT